MAKFRKSEEELNVELQEQIAAFRASLHNYDLGSRWEAKRIAASIYILCFDGSGRTKSLFGILGLKSKFSLLSSHVYQDTNNIEIAVISPPTSLLMIRGKDGVVEFCPAIDYNLTKLRPNWLSFSKWWEEIIFHPVAGVKLSRKNIVFSVRTQDGGGHVDDHLTNLDYKILRTIGQPHVQLSAGDGTPGAPPGNLVWPIIRQIGWELDESMKKFGL